MNSDNWKQRRKAQYIAFALSLVFIVAAALYPHLVPMAAPFYLFLGVLIGGYQASALIDDKSKRGA